MSNNFKKRMNRFSVEEQMVRYNLSREDAEIKVSYLKNNMKGVNIFSIDWQMSKYNISREEAEIKISSIIETKKISYENMDNFSHKCMSPLNIEHWIKKGYSITDAEIKICELKDNNIKRLSDNSDERKRNKDIYKHLYTTNIEYYLHKGYSQEDSIKLLKDRQSTFSLEKCIIKYGVEGGLVRFNQRQQKWLKSIEGKIDNNSKDSTSFDFFLKRNNNDNDSAIKDYLETYNKRYKNSTIGKASKTSMKLFKILINRCNENDLKYFCGYGDSREYYIFDTDEMKVYSYDFTIPQYKLIFEFHGSFWHRKEETNDMNSLGVSMSESYKKDVIKNKLAEKNGFKIIELYEEDGIEHNIKKMFDIFNSYNFYI